MFSFIWGGQYNLRNSVFRFPVVVLWMFSREREHTHFNLSIIQRARPEPGALPFLGLWENIWQSIALLVDYNERFLAQEGMRTIV
jgi:hypothetical protein